MSKKNILGGVIKALRKQKKMTQAKMSEKTGFSQNTISNHENMNRSMHEFDIQKYAQALDIDVQDLFNLIDTDLSEDRPPSINSIYNKLNQTRQEYVYNVAKGQLEKQNQVIQFPNVAKEDNRHKVDISGVVAAGYGITNFDKENIYKTVYLEHVPKRYDLALEIKGDSMYPLFEDGEIIFVDKTSEIFNGILIAVEINDEAFLKKIYLEDNRVRLTSLNNEKDANGNRIYPDFYADEYDNVHIIGKVL